MPMPEHDRTARDLSETIYAAYVRQASGPLHPQQEQALLTRLAEALTPVVSAGSAQGAVAAANAVLSAWEQVEPDIHGPRVEAIDLESASATVAANR